MDILNVASLCSISIFIYILNLILRPGFPKLWYARKINKISLKRMEKVDTDNSAKGLSTVR